MGNGSSVEENRSYEHEISNQDKDPIEYYIYEGKRGERVPSNATNIIFKPGIQTIQNHAFSNCKFIKTMHNIPPTVTSIGNWAFYKCTSLQYITIPSNVESIGKHAFKFCASLSRIDLPLHIVQIGDGAFHMCFLRNIYAPSHIIIGQNSFHTSGSFQLVRKYKDGWTKVGVIIMLRKLVEDKRAHSTTSSPLVQLQEAKDEDTFELGVIQHLIIHENDDMFRNILEFVV